MDDKNFEMEDIIQRVLAKFDAAETSTATQSKEKPNGGEDKMIQKTCNLTEFVGATKFGDTIGLVIANVDSSLL